MVLDSQHQKTWYENHKEKCAEYILQPEYQASDRKFHQVHHHQIYIKRLCLIFVLTLLQMCLKKLIVQFV